MIVLGIDTSGYINAVGVIDDAAPDGGIRVLADNRFPARTDTLEQIVDNIDVTLKQAGISLKDVDAIGVGLGPGSWTGIKVGVTVGKMLAFSTGKPVAGIPTLDALAYGVSDKSLPVYAVISAGVKDMVYAARYHFQGDEPVRDGEYYAGDVRGLAKLINEPVILTGQNANYYWNILKLENEPVRSGDFGDISKFPSKPPKNEPTGDKIEPDASDFTDNTLHNIEKVPNNEPARTRNAQDISQHIGSLKINEPAQSGFVNAITGINKGNLENEPVQSKNVDGASGSNGSAIENEPAGAWIACLALLRLKHGMGDNPLGLTPMYLKESTAKVFVNKYMGNKEK